MPSVKGGGRVILVLDTDPSSHRNKVIIASTLFLMALPGFAAF